MPNLFQAAFSITKAVSSFSKGVASVCNALQRLGRGALRGLAILHTLASNSLKMFDRSICTAPQYSHHIQAHPSPNLRAAALHLVPIPPNFQSPVILSNSSLTKFVCLSCMESIQPPI
ncbi:hypothetical protein IG631_21423 [Alternaria alternata]|nr:hypothetical protein IG631_21423 [Alternaria alternata]